MYIYMNVKNKLEYHRDFISCMCNASIHQGKITKTQISKNFTTQISSIHLYISRPNVNNSMATRLNLFRMCP